MLMVSPYSRPEQFTHPSTPLGSTSSRLRLADREGNIYRWNQDCVEWERVQEEGGESQPGFEESESFESLNEMG